MAYSKRKIKINVVQKRHWILWITKIFVVAVPIVLCNNKHAILLCLNLFKKSTKIYTWFSFCKSECKLMFLNIQLPMLYNGAIVSHVRLKNILPFVLICTAKGIDIIYNGEDISIILYFVAKITRRQLLIIWLIILSINV